MTTLANGILAGASQTRVPLGRPGSHRKPPRDGCPGLETAPATAWRDHTLGAEFERLGAARNSSIQREGRALPAQHTLSSSVGEHAPDRFLWVLMQVIETLLRVQIGSSPSEITRSQSPAHRHHRRVKKVTVNATCTQGVLVTPLLSQRGKSAARGVRYPTPKNA